MRMLFDAIPTDRRLVSTGPDRFSPHEVVAHLADWEPILRSRIETALTQPGSPIVAYDEGERALEQNYSSWDASRSLETFAAERVTTRNLLMKIEAADWTKSVLHPERGRQTVADIAMMLLGHDLYHIRQLLEAGR